MRAILHALRQRRKQFHQQWLALVQSRPQLVRRTLLGTASVAILVCLATTVYLVSLWRDLPSKDTLDRIGEMDQATAIFDAGDQLAFTIFKEQRIDVPLRDVSPNAINALLAIEDQRFYNHRGFDLIRIGSATLTNLRHLRFAQGASTITQQLARMSFLKPERTVRRKLQELMLARQIEANFSKDQILGMYLNKAYFGDGLYGIEAAARGYFGKHAHDLTTAEGALLAGLVKSPSTYAPTLRLKRAVARRNVVLAAMKDAGTIDREQYESARQANVVLQDSLGNDEPAGLYFKEQVRQELVDRLGWQRVYQGGLRVYTTINMDVQRSAEAAVAAHLKTLDQRRAELLKKRGEPADPEPLQAALVAMEPSTGHVLAMVGGRDFEHSHFNRAVQAKRQPGSAFKPFVYATAIESGYAPASVLRNLSAPVDTLQGAWTPDDEHLEGDTISLRAALRTSSNRAAVQLLQRVGIRRTVEYAKAMGIGDLPSVPSLALGSGETTLLALSAAYGGFANGGDVPTPMMIRRVEDGSGHLLYEAHEQTKHAINATTAYLMSTMLADVVNAGTAAGARSAFKLPAAGKTGTTNDFHDAWFIGYTPSLVAGVWVGFDQPKPILPRGFASDVAVPIWANFMRDATKGAKPEWFKAPPGIVGIDVCRASGALATDACLQADAAARATGSGTVVYTDYFVRGTEPTGYCVDHAQSGVASTVAAAFSTSERPMAPQLTLNPAEPVATVRTSEPTEPPKDLPEDAPRKRGFWSRVLRIGGAAANERNER
jgi:penicillin-binding protein 1A